MAISGSGSVNDPYIVANRGDINSAINFIRGKNNPGTYYIRLSSNIDGDWDEFTPVRYTDTTTRFFDLDMNGHHIRNFRCSNGMFFGVNGDVIRNGNIYNIYSNGSTNGWISGVECVNMSLSQKVGSFLGTLLDDIRLTRSALWVSIDDYDAYFPIVRFRESDMFDESTMDNSNESDYMFIVKNVNTTEALFIDTTNSSITIGETCRFRGEIKNFTRDTMSSYPQISNSNASFENSVIDFSCPVYSGTYTGQGKTMIVPAGTTGIINEDKILDKEHIKYDMVGLIAVTNSEIKSASALNAKGFEVHDIS